MQTLKRKDKEGRKQGKPKRCWFIESIEEIVQPLRFDATTLANSLDTYDFVKMYPSIPLTTLLTNVRTALQEGLDTHQQIPRRWRQRQPARWTLPNTHRLDNPR